MKHAVIRRTVRKFAEEKLVPAAVEMDEKAEFPLALAEEMALLQYFGLEIPSVYGGAGLDSVSYAIVIEEISKASGAMGLCISVHNSVSAFPVYEFGSEAQRQKFLIPMAISLGFGVMFATGITLLLIPCFYLILEDIHRAWERLRAGSRVQAGTARQG